MRPVLYLYRSCTSCRNAVAVLEELGVEFEAREYFKDPFTREELEWLLDRADMAPSDLVSTRSAPYRTEKLAERNLKDEELFERMLGEPRLIRRPVLVTTDEVVVGFNRSRFEDVARRLAE